MKNNNDLDFLKYRIEQENVQPPQALDAQGVKNIIYPQQPKRIKFTQRTGFKVGVTVAACLVAFIAVGAFAVPRLFGDRVVQIDDNTDIQTALPTFSSYAEIEGKVKAASKARGESKSVFGFNPFAPKYSEMFAIEEDAAESGAVEGGAKSDGTNYSATNVQVEGVDEGDILKNDGKHIFFANNRGTIMIYEPKGESTELVSEITDFEYDYYGGDVVEYDYYDGDVYTGGYSAESVCEMFVYGDKLVVSTNSDSYSGGYGSEYTNTYIYDVSDIKNPTKLASFSQSGCYVSARMVGSQLYVVSNETTYYYDRTIDAEDYAPKCGENGELETLPLDCIRYVQNGETDSSSFLVISSIDVETCEKTADTQAVFGMSSDIYCNENTMYAASRLGYDTEETEIFKISLSRDKIEFVGRTTVDGTVNNQFSMDEYNGYFRIAVTDFNYGYEEGESKHENMLYVFDENMKEVGRVSSFAKGESIKSVRFMGDIAYVITYEDIDPLFVIDLSSPENPKILGEVEITGFSSQLLPIDENTILGIGYATVPSGYKDMERTDGVKLALFDVSDKANPKVLDSVVIPNVTSNAQSNHRAIAIDKKNGRIAIDVTDLESYYVYDEETDDYTYSDYQHIGAVTFEIKDGKIVMTNEFETKSSSEYSYASRCTFTGDYVYVLDDDGNIYPFKY